MLKIESFKKRYIKAARRRIYDEINSAERINSFLFDTYRLNWKERPSNSQFGALREISAYINGEDEGLLAIKKWICNLKANLRWSNSWLQWLNSEDSKKFSEIKNKNRCDWEAEIKNGNLGKFIVDTPCHFWKFAEMEAPHDKNLDRFAMRTFFDILCEAIFDASKKEKGERV